LKELLDIASELGNPEQLVREAFERELRENEAWVVERVSEEQLYEQGKRGDGVSINSFAPYAPRTVADKIRKGQPVDRVTLRDRGDFHRGFYIEFYPDGFAISSTDNKTDDLVRSYGEEIMQLSDDNMQDVVESYILPAVQEIIARI